MKNLFSLLVLLGWMAVATAQNAKPFVIPELKEWKGAE